jgi:glycosyltransferase involved in cell wall biosynthesis
VRLNRVDAFGVSIVEAMSAGVPALATNVCRRPDGCLVFSDYDELFDKLAEVIDSDNPARAVFLDGFVVPNDHKEIIRIYREQCSK